MHKEFEFKGWKLIFDRDYQVISDDKKAVVLNDDRDCIVLLECSDEGNILIKRTYYAIVYEVHSNENKISFHYAES